MRITALLTGLALAASGGTFAAPQQSQPFTAATTLVVVPVVVVDRKGQTIPHLTAADFQITEDGKPVAIEDAGDIEQEKEPFGFPRNDSFLL